MEMEPQLATSRFPDAVRTVLLPIAVALAGLIEMPEPKESFIRVTIEQGQMAIWDIDAPWVGCYSHKEVKRTQVVLRHLLEHPDSRDLLDKPEHLLRMLQK
ncbi:hypothetical protein GCM10027562_11240 [Arthrobacter pigmenti]